MKFLQQLSTLQKITVAILFVVVINLISFFFFIRLDVTKNGLYSFSPATQKLVKNLDDIITVKVFFTDNLSAPYSTNRRYIKDQLDELRSYSGGKLTYQLIDPSNNPEAEAEAEQLGIPSLQINVVENERYEMKRAYMGLAILYENSKETLPVIQTLNNFEFDFATAVNRLVNKELPILATSSDFGMNAWEGKQGIRQYLDKQYKMETISLEAPIDGKIKSLLLFSPNMPISENAKAVIYQFLERGGNVAWLFDRVEVNLQQGQAKGIESGMDSIFAKYGLTVSDNLVQDLESASINVQEQRGFFTIANQVQFPFLPIISNINQESEIARGLTTVSPIFASEITLSAIPEKLIAKTVLRTSKSSRVQRKFYTINPYEKYDRSYFTESNLPIAIALEGQFGQAESKGRLFVMTDGEFVTDNYINNAGNAPFILNIIYWITDGSELLAIPTKNDFIVPLPEMEPLTKQFIKYLNLLVPPIAILIWGVIRWRTRKNLSEMGAIS